MENVTEINKTETEGTRKTTQSVRLVSQQLAEEKIGLQIRTITTGESSEGGVDSEGKQTQSK